MGWWKHDPDYNVLVVTLVTHGYPVFNGQCYNSLSAKSAEMLTHGKWPYQALKCLAQHSRSAVSRLWQIYQENFKVCESVSVDIGVGPERAPHAHVDVPATKTQNVILCSGQSKSTISS